MPHSPPVEPSILEATEWVVFAVAIAVQIGFTGELCVGVFLGIPLVPLAVGWVIFSIPVEVKEWLTEFADIILSIPVCIDVVAPPVSLGE